MPIVFALGVSGFLGLVLGNFSLQKLPSSLVAGSQSWVLLAIPTFVFAGSLMERCGMTYALVNLARVLVGWLRGGLGVSRSEEHTSELQSQSNLVCRLLLEKKKKK